MSDFLRKASLKMKGSHSDLAGLSNGKPSVLLSKPPKSRSASAASSMAESDPGDDIEPGARKRRQSLAKRSKKRLSSLFSSNSLSSHLSDTERSNRAGTSSPLVRSSPLNLSRSSSTASLSTREAKADSVPVKARGAAGTNGVSRGMGKLSLVSGPDMVSASPESTSPLATRPRALSELRRGSAPGGSGPPAPAPAKQKAESLYSQWDEDEDDESSDDDVFLTPSEGLSEIGEGDEEEGVTASSAAGATPGVAGAAAIAAERKEVPKGAEADTADIFGTGPSTLRRTKPISSETRVRPRPVTKAQALSFDQAAALGPDADLTRHALFLFLSSKMKESEDLCYEKDPEGIHLYLQNAYGIIQGLKGMMTFDSNDLLNALEICKNVHIAATALRKPSDSIITRVGGLVRSGAGVQRVRQMTILERHAELVYAESSLMKALLAIVAGGDWFGFIREALNMRAAWGIYRTLQQFTMENDKAAKGGYDEEIDEDFRSGVVLGAGTSSLMLSLLPGKVMKIAEVFGYAGDRDVALNTLYSAGGWSKTSEDPARDENDEGLRRPVCDMILLAFHLVISLLMPVAGVDIPMAGKILKYNMRRYPDGIFFLYFQSRLHTARCEPEIAIQTLQRALDLQLEYVQLQHMCLWDYALNHMILGNWKGALDCFTILREESNWSRAVYTYSSAACLMELVADGRGDIDEADKLMKEVPKLTKKMAGKSLPIEKLASRKTRKFQSQGRRLFLPAMELAYVFGSLYQAPRRCLLNILVPRIDKYLEALEAKTPEQYGSGYWDDYCLGHFLRGVCYAVARYQPPEAAPSAREGVKNSMSDQELDDAAEKNLTACVKHAPNVELDHYISYHCHFELGKLYAKRGDNENAQKNFNVVMTGKALVPNTFEQKSQGKYSLEGALQLKTHSAMQAVKEGRGGA